MLGLDYSAPWIPRRLLFVAWELHRIQTSLWIPALISLACRRSLLEARALPGVGVGGGE